MQRRTLAFVAVLSFVALNPCQVAVAALCASALQGTPSASATAHKGGTEPPSHPTMAVEPLDRGLDFRSVAVGSTSPVQTVTVTVQQASDSSAKVNATASGDFAVGAPMCELRGQGKCAFSVSFAPKTEGDAEGALTIVLTSEGTPSQTTVNLTGRGLPCGKCSEDENAKAFTSAWYRAVGPMLLVVLLYLTGIILIRWHSIARPTRTLLQAAIEGVRARIDTLKATLGANPPAGIAQLEGLVAKAGQLVEDKKFIAMLPDYILWNRGQEASAWNCLHEAEEQMVLAYGHGTPYESLAIAELGQAELKLRQLNSPIATELAEQIKIALAPPVPPAPPPSFDALKSLLNEALGFLYDRTDTNFAELISWHNKTMWLIGAALLLIVSLGAALQHEIFFLIGAAGGLLSRLSRSLNRADVPTDYGASWTTLFLSPVVGALAGWCGVLLLILAAQLNILGTALKVEWCNPYCALALGAALLLGTSERAFDTVLNQLEEKLKAQQATAKPGQINPETKK